MKIGIILAMQKEMDAIASVLGGNEGAINGNTIKLMLSGIGKVNAAVHATQLINEFKPDCIISSGCAGGLRKGVGLMDVVASREVAYHDVWCGVENEKGQIQGLPVRFRSSDALYETAMKLDTETKIHGGLICSGDQFIDTPEASEKIRSNFPDVLAADMESGAIAQVCHIFNVPFISFRVVSDAYGEENRCAQYDNFWAEIGKRSFGVISEYLNNLPKSI